jgi:hypothetical protein
LLVLRLQPDAPALPRDVRLFFREADRRIERFRRARRIPGFVPSDFPMAYVALRALEGADLVPGPWFCEWGSGFGVVACLAAMLGFEARGIEVEGDLVDAARRLAGDFGLPVEFARGSFIPAGAQPLADAGAGFAWLTASAGGGQELLGLGPDEFDVVFAYPWPDEERLTAGLFARYARAGAVLVTYHEVGGLRLRRKTGTRPGGPRPC